LHNGDCLIIDQAYCEDFNKEDYTWCGANSCPSASATTVTVTSTTTISFPAGPCTTDSSPSTTYTTSSTSTPPNTPLPENDISRKLLQALDNIEGKDFFELD
jgi:hypothetical protein